MNLSKTSKKCLKCPHYDYCDEKRMAACALMEIPVVPVIIPNTKQNMMPTINNPKSVMMTIEHQLNTRDMEREIFRELRLGCHFRRNGD